jgi:glutaminyl-peptide cyclotransferase
MTKTTVVAAGLMAALMFAACFAAPPAATPTPTATPRGLMESLLPSPSTTPFPPTPEAAAPLEELSPSVTPTVSTPALYDFDGERAMQYVEAQMAFGPRPTGSEASAQVGDYIIEQLEAAGMESSVQAFVYQGVEARNIVGMRGAGEPLRIFAAHYDTRLLADQDATSPDQPVPGANDGASGVAVLLELAFALDWDTISGEVWFVFFDAEDNGRIAEWEWIVGSRHFADQLTATPQYLVLLDMIGDADQQLYYEGNSDPVLSEQIWSLAAELGYSDYFIPTYRHYMIDDHIPFVERGIPAVDIIDFDYPYWHTTADTIDKLDAASLERVGHVLEVFLESGGLRRSPVASEG